MTSRSFDKPLTTTPLASLLTLALLIPALGACAPLPESDTDRAPPPPPGMITVAEPLKLTERARIPEKEPGFIDATAGARRIEINHDASFPALAAGDVLAGTQGGGYLARVIAITQTDASHTLAETEPAALTELLSEGDIRIHYDAAEYAARLEDHFAAEQARGEDGGERVASRAEALTIAGAAPIKLLELAGKSLPASCGVRADNGADLDVRATLSPVIDIELKISKKEGLSLKPQLEHLRLVAGGHLDIDAELRATGTVDAGCSVDLLALAGGGAGIPLPALTFWVGPVPVVVTTDVVPMASADVDLSLEAAEMTAAAHTSVGLEAGVDYKQGDWSTVWDPYCHASGDAAVQSPGDLRATCTVRAGAELRARLYGVLGPNLGVEAYARARARSAYPYCDYSGRIDGGVNAYAEAALGVSVGPLDLTLAELPLTEMELVHFNGPAFTGELRDAPECY